MNSPSPEDRLLDELLREQAKGPDETFLKQIEAAVDAGAVRAAKRPVANHYKRLAIAASVALAAGAGIWSLDRKEKKDIAKTESALSPLRSEGKDRPSSPVGGESRSELLLEQKRRLQIAPSTSSRRVFAEGATASYSIPEQDENIGEMSTLSSLSGGEKAGGLGGSGSGKGFGKASPEKSRSKDATFAASRADGDKHIGDMAYQKDAAPEPQSGDRYGTFIDQPWKSPDRDPLSTFSIDVDTASYGNVRRMIREGRQIPKDAVRIEECINAFDYHYEKPKGGGPFAVSAKLAVCPWDPAHQLVRVAIKGREIEANKRPASNLVFLIDVSGSMQSPDKLPLLKQSMATLVEQLDERDRVAIVVYAGSEGVALPSTRIDAEGRAKVLQSLAKLEAGGSTNGGAGIKRAYELAMQDKTEGGVNRVILATDGDFNVGVTGQGSLVELVKERAKGGVYLTVVGFGTGNLNDAMMDAITRDGNGNYFYVDSEREGRKVFLKNLTGTLVTIAKDVKIQVEFNPAKVGGYRLIGYSNRVLRNEDFNNDKVDAGDIGAGHTVTAFYELTPPGGAAGTDSLKYQATPPKPAATDEWLTVKLRHKHPEGDESSKIEFPLTSEALALDKTDVDFQFATAVALFGMKLRGMEEVRDIAWENVMGLAKPGLANDATEDRAEFVELLKKLAGEPKRVVPEPAEVSPVNRPILPPTR
jgi:Ca-activated chloride channel family protein